MSGSEDLMDLLTVAARSVGSDAQPDPVALITRARRIRSRQKLLSLAAVVAVIFLGAATLPPLLNQDKGDVSLAAGGSLEGLKPGWTQMPDAPLSHRVGATTIWTGREVVVVGGITNPCPPNASCRSAGQPATDGAAFDPASQIWRPIAPAPVAFSGVTAVVLDGDVVLLAPCDDGKCDNGATVLRYRPLTDIWAILPPPPAPRLSTLVAVGRGLVAYGTAVSAGRLPSWSLDMASLTWVQLPADPLPDLTEPRMVADGDDLLLFGRDARGYKTPMVLPVLGARLTLATGVWKELPSVNGGRVQSQTIDGRVVVEPTRAGAGGILEPEFDVWSLLPAPPVRFLGEDTVVAGILGRTSSGFTSAAGIVIDLTSRKWITLAPLPDRLLSSEGGITSIGRRLFLFAESVSSDTQAGAQNDSWVWTPPDNGDSSELEATELLTLPPTTSPGTSTTLPSPVAPGSVTTGTPELVSATGDLTAGQITLRFSHNVVPGDGPNANGFNMTKRDPSLTPMQLVVHRAGDTTCDSPNGNAQEYLAGGGTDTLTVAATSLVAGTTYISIGPGFAKNANDGTAMSPVKCLPIKVTGAPKPIPPTTVVAEGAPRFVSATGTATPGRITLRFDRPVVAGTVPAPASMAGTPGGYMSAMRLVVFGTDAACTGPQGNAHEYLAGVGTDSITVEASSLVAGTSYIAINAGFVNSTDSAVPNGPVRTANGAPAAFASTLDCIPIKVAG